LRLFILPHGSTDSCCSRGKRLYSCKLDKLYGFMIWFMHMAESLAQCRLRSEIRSIYDHVVGLVSRVACVVSLT